AEPYSGGPPGRPVPLPLAVQQAEERTIDLGIRLGCPPSRERAVMRGVRLSGDVDGKSARSQFDAHCDVVVIAGEPRWDSADALPGLPREDVEVYRHDRYSRIKSPRKEGAEGLRLHIPNAEVGDDAADRFASVALGERFQGSECLRMDVDV